MFKLTHLTTYKEGVDYFYSHHLLYYLTGNNATQQLIEPVTDVNCKYCGLTSN